MTKQRPKEELLPCPFCGARAETDSRQSYRRIDTGDLREQAAVFCTGCGAGLTFCYADAPEIPRDQVMEDLIQQWNGRTTDTSRIADVLREHWLTGIQCNHDDKTDVATCFCARWRSADAHNVASAVSDWINHVLEQIA